MEQDNTEKQLDKVDSYLTKFGIILKKHWGKLLLILVGYCVYWAFTQPAPVQEEEQYQIIDSSYIAPGDTVYEEE